MSIESLREFYRKWMMSRKFNPRDFGIKMDAREFKDLMIEQCAQFTGGQISLDGLLLRPTLALEFIQKIRKTYGWFDVPEYVILSPIMNRRKSPGR